LWTHDQRDRRRDQITLSALTVTARGGDVRSGRDEEMAASWPNKEMKDDRRSKLDNHRPHTSAKRQGSVEKFQLVVRLRLARKAVAGT